MPASMFFGRGGGEEDGGGGPAAVETFHFTKDGLVGWYKADAITGLTDGQTVATWSDSSPGGNDATQASEANKPVYKTNILNGLPVVRFDGSNANNLRADNVAATFSGTDKATSTFAVVKFTTLDTAIPVAAGKSDSATPYHFPFRDAGASWRISKRDDLAVEVSPTAGTVDSSWHAFASIIPGTTASLFVDGATIINGAAFDVGATTLDTFAIGLWRNTTNNSPLTGDIAEVLVYNRGLTLPESRQVERYLGNKYSITIG